VQLPPAAANGDTALRISLVFAGQAILAWDVTVSATSTNNGSGWHCPQVGRVVVLDCTPRQRVADVFLVIGAALGGVVSEALVDLYGHSGCHWLICLDD
jgi:hypothetical protein